MGKLKDKVKEKLGEDVAGALEALVNPCAPNPIATLVQSILAQVFVIKERIITQIEGLKDSFGNLKNINAQALKAKYGSNITLNVLRQEFGDDVLTQLNAACPTKPKLLDIIKKRNQLANGLDQIERKVDILLKTGRTVSKIPPPLKIVLKIIKFAPIPAAVVPTGAINFAGDILENLKKLLEQFARIGCGIKEVGDIIGDILGQIQDAIEFLDVLILICAQNSVLQEQQEAISSTLPTSPNQSFPLNIPTSTNNEVGDPNSFGPTGFSGGPNIPGALGTPDGKPNEFNVIGPFGENPNVPNLSNLPGGVVPLNNNGVPSTTGGGVGGVTPPNEGGIDLGTVTPGEEGGGGVGNLEGAGNPSNGGILNTGLTNFGGLPIGTFPEGEDGLGYQDINNLLNELGADSLDAINSEDLNNNSYQYKGFTFEIRFDKSNTTPWPLRYAVAINTKGQVQLTSDSSFASEPSVLINELKFLIDVENIEAE